MKNHYLSIQEINTLSMLESFSFSEHQHSHYYNVYVFIFVANFAALTCQLMS